MTEAAEEDPTVAYPDAIQRTGDVVTLNARGELDFAALVDLRDMIATAVGAAGPLRAVVIDLAEATFLDCAALNVLIEGKRAAAASGTVLRIRNPREMVLLVLEMTETLDYLSGE